MLGVMPSAFACSVKSPGKCSDTEQKKMVDRASCSQLKQMNAKELRGDAKALHFARVPACNLGSALGSVLKSDKKEKEE